MQKPKFIYILIPALLFFFIYYAYAYNLPKRFLFNKENALQEWQEKIFKNKVLYVVETTQEGGYLSARSEKACSGLLYKISFNTKKSPMMSWYWKVKEFPEKNISAKKEDGWIEKDDYAARVYVVFPSWNFMNIKSIEYIWDESIPEETIMTSPYFNNIKLIVIESGRENMDQWVFEKRNIYEDYRKAFGRAPSSVGAIALMTDTDNTLSTAEASYKDIQVGYRDE
ncbi:MAG: DUF3047 domain-containing protein [Candidatus Omnitrophica bacterium]|nr:DUF3047 domain-containing protein [Candidatus Omnitrophota bacterium]MBU1853211.1 DUF3047 domain-containing protein [Candidatus Omnitrophota bacterium]